MGLEANEYSVSEARRRPKNNNFPQYTSLKLPISSQPITIKYLFSGGVPPEKPLGIMFSSFPKKKQKR
jgi:hypothetical protein